MYILVDIFLERGFDAVENSITKQAVVRVEDNKENKDEEQLYYLIIKLLLIFVCLIIY